MCNLDPALQECETLSYLHKVCLPVFSEHPKTAHTIRLKPIQLFPLMLTHSYLVLPRDRLHLYDMTDFIFLLNETLICLCIDMYFFSLYPLVQHCTWRPGHGLHKRFLSGHVFCACKTSVFVTLQNEDQKHKICKRLYGKTCGTS